MNQNGNAIFIILVAVALFAALGYAFSNTSRTSTSFITGEEAKAYVNQIIAYGNEVKSAVKRLQLRGCSDTEISFENSFVSGYTNGNSPTDRSCHVFDTQGGGLTYVAPPEGILQKPSPMTTEYGDWFFTGRVTISGFGYTWDDLPLTMILPYITLNACMQINQNLERTGFPGDTPQEDNTTTAQLLDEPFVGAYNWGGAGDIDGWATGGGTNDYWTGVLSGCTLMTDGYYLFYKILLPRK